MFPSSVIPLSLSQTLLASISEKVGSCKKALKIIYCNNNVNKIVNKNIHNLLKLTYLYPIVIIMANKIKLISSSTKATSLFCPSILAKCPSLSINKNVNNNKIHFAIYIIVNKNVNKNVSFYVYLNVY